MKTAQELQVEFLNMRLLQSENQRVILCRKLENSVSKETYEAAVADRNMYKAERDHERKLRENAELKNEELEKEIIGYKCKIAALESEKAEFKDLADLMRKEDLDNKSVADMLKGLLYARSSEKLDMEAAQMFGELPEGQAALLAMAARFVNETSGQQPETPVKRNALKKSAPADKKRKKPRGPYRQYGVEILEDIGIDTTGMEARAKVILRKQKEDKFTLQLLYISPGKVYAKNYEIARLYVPGIGQVSSNRPKDEFLTGCPASASFATFYWSAKCQYNISEQKILELLDKMGCRIPQETLNEWMHKVIDYVFDRIYPAMLQEIRSSHILNMDETRLCVRSNVDGKICYNTEYVHGHLSTEKRLFLMTYRNGTRAHDVPEDILRDSGVDIIMVDRCSIYPKAVKDIGEGVIERQADWVHARRYIRNAFKADHRIKPLYEKITRLFQLENLFREQGLSDRQRFAQRLLISKLIVDAIFAELKAIKAEIHKYGKLVRWMVDYFLDDEEAFRIFLRHGELDIDNNAIERLFRHLAMGRRNWMHVGSHNAARNISFMYSLLESCKLNKIDFSDYLNHLLAHINDKGIDLKTLLPNLVELTKLDCQASEVA